MIFHESPDLWDYLAKTEKTVVLYGMGNGADKILAVCAQKGIAVADFFASDGFVRGHSFHGKVVLSYSAVKEKYGVDNLIVLLSFGSSLPEVLALFDRMDAECEFYAPDVPVCGEGLFDHDFYVANQDKFQQARVLLADDESRRILDRIIAYKLEGRLARLRETVCSKEEIYGMLDAAHIVTAADLGAYNGDTVRELMDYAPSLSRVLAMEPDRRNFRKLSDFAAAVDIPRVTPVHAAAWCEETTLSFAASGNRNAGAFAPGKQVEVAAKPLDTLLQGESVDYIKYDVEGAEHQALLGSAETLRAHRPRLLVSAYHRNEDLFDLPLLIHRLRPDYRIYLRRTPYVPAWDLNWICV